MFIARSHTRTRPTSDTVVCLHASASTSRQWQPLVNELTHEQYTLITPDLVGYGQGPKVEPDFSMDDEVELVLAHVGERDSFHLVGHSYGGSVALQVARQIPERILSLTIYEPAAFTYLQEAKPAVFAQIEKILGGVAQFVTKGQHVAAAKLFINYWVGDQAFEQMPDYLQQIMIRCMPKVQLEWQAVLTLRSTMADLEQLMIPTLLITGSRSTEEVRTLTALLHQTLPDSDLVELAGLEHMAPVTQPTAVNPHIVSFLANFQPVEASLVTV